MYNNKQICVCLPVYNEEKTIGVVIDSIGDFVDWVIVVDDGSDDRSAEIANEKNVIVLRHGRNKGLGRAFDTGIKKALELGADIIVNMDGDGQFNASDIIKLIEPIVNEEADFVTASRFKDPSYYPKMSRVKFYGNKMMSLFISTIIGQKFYDVSCGFRAYSRDTALQLNLFGEFTYTQEAFIDLAFKNMSIVEVPVKVKGRREFGKSKVASSILKYAYKSFVIILRTVRDYRSFKFFALFSLFLFLFGSVLGFFVGAYFISTGLVTPYKWAAFTSGFLLILSVLVLILGFITDMFSRMRLNQEKMLYKIKLLECEKKSNDTVTR